MNILEKVIIVIKSSVPSPTAYNTVYAVRSVHANCAFGTISHTPKPLAEMVRPRVNCPQ